MSYSRTKRKVILKPATMVSPSGEVEVTMGLNGWVIKARGLYASGRGAKSLAEAMGELATELAAGGAPEPANELHHIAGQFS